MRKLNFKHFMVRTLFGVVTAITVNIIVTIILTSLTQNGSMSLQVLPWVSIGSNAAGCLLGILVAKGSSDLPIFPLCVVVVIMNAIISALIDEVIFDGVSEQLLYHIIAGLAGGTSVAFLGRGRGIRKYK